MHRVLKNDGVAIVSTPNWYFERLDHVGLGFENPYHVHVMKLREFRHRFEQYFTVRSMLGVRAKRSKVCNMLRHIDQFNVRLLLGRSTRSALKRLPMLERGTMSQSGTNDLLADPGVDTDTYEVFRLHRYSRRSASSFIAIGVRRA
jgi:hypothetical protein